ncbi:DNA-binding protein [Roseiflexus sp.]|uniref:DNA-binding protein n=1 Tax=Roseiflexus TaxID=120961 RepID=UPI0035B54703
MDQVVTVRGATGAYVDRNEFLFDDGTGQIVVDSGPPWFRQVSIAIGTPVTVTGQIDRMRGGGIDLDACQITTPTETIQIRDCSFSGPPPWAGGPKRRGSRR